MPGLGAVISNEFVKSHATLAKVWVWNVNMTDMPNRYLPEQLNQIKC